MLLCTYIKCFDFRRENTSVPCATKGDRQGLGRAKKSSDIPCGDVAYFVRPLLNSLSRLVARKIFLFPSFIYPGERISRKNSLRLFIGCSAPVSGRRLFLFAQALCGLLHGIFLPPKLEHSIPAPSSIAVKKKVRNYETNRKK